MNKHFLAQLFFGFFVTYAAFGQGGVQKLLIARASTGYTQTGMPPTNRDSTTYQYDGAQRQAGALLWNAFFSDSLGLYARMVDYVYDGADHLLSQTSQDFLGDSTWKNKGRFTTNYDMAGRLLSNAEEHWADTAWVFYTGATWAYNSIGQVVSVTTASGHRTVFTYNAQGLQKSETTQVFFNGDWYNQSRKVLNYSVQNGVLPTGYLVQVWNGSVWVDYHKATFTYDANMDKTGELFLDWDGSAWINNYNNTYAYDSNHNIVYFLLEQWLNGAWKGTYREYSTYDSDSNILTNRVEGISGNTWVTQTYTRYYYTELVGISTPSPLSFNLFPNPAMSAVTLHGENLSHVNIFDQQGRILRSQVLQDQTEETIQLGNLPAGNYFLQVIGKNGVRGVKPLQIRH